jgi:hypothetical protein
MKPFDHRIFFLLDNLPPRAIKSWIKLHDKIIDYTAEHFAYFAHKRSQLIENLKQSLQEKTTSFEFSNWRRIISHQFSNAPLSTLGSVKSFPGGRFNIGDIDIERFPKFPALYLAEDTTTAFLEVMGLKPEIIADGLTGKELAAAGNYSHFVVQGRLTNILDLTNSESLQPFYTNLKNIELPIYYRKKANQLKISPMPPVKNLEELRKTLFAEEWRLMPMQFDAPANSQILGQIAHSAGIEAILYPSVKTNQKALAVYPENFINSDAFVEITGAVAETVIHTRIDKDTYKNFLP